VNVTNDVNISMIIRVDNVYVSSTLLKVEHYYFLQYYKATRYGVVCS